MDTTNCCPSAFMCYPTMDSIILYSWADDLYSSHKHIEVDKTCYLKVVNNFL